MATSDGKTERRKIIRIVHEFIPLCLGHISFMNFQEFVINYDLYSSVNESDDSTVDARQYLCTHRSTCRCTWCRRRDTPR